MRIKYFLSFLLTISIPFLWAFRAVADDQDDTASNETPEDGLSGELANIYQPADALTMAQLSGIVYQFGDLSKPNYKNQTEFSADIQRMQKEARDIGYEMVTYKLYGEEKLFTEGAVFAAIFQNDAHYVLVFRGTVINSVANWSADANIVHVPWVSAGRVHRGFNHIEENLWPFVKDFFSDPVHRSKPVWVTGHSMGAAVATLGALHLSSEFADINIEKIYVYAQPRVGDKSFVETYAKLGLERRFIKFAEYNDMVSVLPPAAAGFYDTKNIILLEQNNELAPYAMSYSLSALLHFDRMILHAFRMNLHDVEHKALGGGNTDTAEEDNDALWTEDLDSVNKVDFNSFLQRLLQIQFRYVVASHDIKSYINTLENLH